MIALVDITGLAILLISVAIITTVIDGVSIPPETLYILTGILISQSIVLGDIILFAEAGAVFLVFYTTINIRIGPIKGTIWTTVPALLLHLFLMAGTMAIATFYGIDPHGSLLIGLTAAIGSSMLAIDVIEEQVDRRLLHGRLTESITFLQDLILLMILGLAAPWAGRSALPSIALIGGAILLAMIGRDPAGRLLKQLEDDEDTTLLLGLSILWATTAVLFDLRYGLIIAPLTAGILLSSHRDNFTLLETVGPIKDLFVTVFLVSLGALLVMPPGPEIWLAALLFIATAIVRPALTVLGLTITGVDRHTSIRTALQLDQISEIVLLLGLVLSTAGLVGDTVIRAVTLAAAASFITSAYTTRHVDSIYGILNRLIKKQGPPVDRDDHTIIGGYGQIGRALAAETDDPVIIDNDPRAITAADEDGFTTVQGDMRDPKTWDRAASDKADTILLTTADDSIAEYLATLSTDAILLTESDNVADRLDDLTGVRAFSEDGIANDMILTQIKELLDAEDSRTG